MPARTWSAVVLRAFAIASARGAHDFTLVNPGQMLLTVTPAVRRSAAMSWENAMIAEFVSPVVHDPGRSCLPVTPETLRMRPPFDFFRYGSACLVVCTAAISFRLRILSHCSAESCSKAPGIRPPTLLTRISMPPSCEAASATNLLQPSSLAKSVTTPAALTPSAWISFTAASSPCAPRPESATLQPSFASAVAIANPMPWLEPVIAAFLPLSPRSMLSPFLLAQRRGHVHVPVEDAPRGAHERRALDLRSAAVRASDQVHLDLPGRMLDREHAAGEPARLDEAVRHRSRQHRRGRHRER